MKKKFFSKVITIFILMGILLQAFPGPAYAAGNWSNHNEGMIGSAADQLDIPPLPNREKIVKFADQVASILILKNGKVSLKHAQISTLKPGQIRLLKRFVKDINSGKIGLAIVTEEGVVVYGNAMALGEDASSPASLRFNRWGAHLYLNHFWTAKLTDLAGWALGIIAGLLVAALCPTGLGCFLVGVIVSYLWDFVIWRTLRRYFPNSVTLHFRKPKWIKGHLVVKRYVQPWRKNKWYNGRRFYRGRFRLI